MNLKKMKQIIAISLTTILLSMNLTVYGEKTENSPEIKAVEETESLSEIQLLSDEAAAKDINASEITGEVKELEAAELENIEYNNMQRSLDNIDNYIVEQKNGISEFSEGDNTNPNYAITISTSTVYQGTISTAGEMRWYNFQVNAKSKRTMKLQMEDTLDADLYLFYYDNGELKLMGGSATAGLGVEENSNDILEAGIYFIAVGGYEGSGNFAFMFTGTDVDVDYEINDTSAQAALIETNTTISGVIDGPNDVDYYKISLSTPSAISYNIVNPGGKSYMFLYAGGAGGYQLVNKVADVDEKEPVILNSGTHYFAVVSNGSSYDPINAYQVKVTAHTSIAPIAHYPNFVYNEKANIFFQFNSERTSYYINGNPIDFTYNYSDHFSAGGNIQAVDIDLMKTPNFNVCLTQQEGLDAGMELQQTVPDILYYSSKWAGISKKYVIMLSVNDWINKCYFIHALSTGDYYPDRLYADLNCANVIIDPGTGKVVDIMWYNYYYEIGNHSCSSIRDLPTKFNYSI